MHATRSRLDQRQTVWIIKLLLCVGLSAYLSLKPMYLFTTIGTQGFPRISDFKCWVNIPNIRESIYDTNQKILYQFFTPGWRMTIRIRYTFVDNSNRCGNVLAKTLLNCNFKCIKILYEDNAQPKHKCTSLALKRAVPFSILRSLLQKRIIQFLQILQYIGVASEYKMPFQFRWWKNKLWKDRFEQKYQ